MPRDRRERGDKYVHCFENGDCTGRYIHPVVLFKYVHVIVCQLYLNRAVKKKLLKLGRKII